MDNSKEEGTIVVFKDLTLDCRRKGVCELDAGDDFLEHGAEGKSVRIAELRAENSALRVDKEISKYPGTISRNNTSLGVGDWHFFPYAVFQQTLNIVVCGFHFICRYCRDRSLLR